MARFFIDRPIFAWVIALFILVFGGVAIKQLPVAQYPTVAPPSILLTTTYPGASAQTLEDSVLSVIEREMNGSPGLIYMESVAQADGTGTITITFATGTDPDLAQVDVQNRLSRATPRLPAAVTQQGVRVDKSRSNFLLFTILSSSNPDFDPIALGDYASRNVLPELQRVPGIGQAQLFGTERSMRVWIDPAKLTGFNLSPADVNAAIKAQNAQVSSGTIGDLPNVAGQGIAATVVVKGQLTSVEQFGAIVLRANTDASMVRMRDVARIELGAQTYATSARLDGEPSTGIGVQLSPSGNALETATLIRNRMTELAGYFPQGVKYEIPYDSSRFVRISIRQVAETLVEAVILVFLVMYLFLQNIRYTLIPTIVVPVALLGTFATMAAFGYSINVLTMFGMVLAIGILVDDAIVVVENVERLMSEEGLPPRQATIKAMGQIQGAIDGITLVLISVYLPLAFFAGSVGNIYRQFSLVMVSAMLFSAFMALSLTPALCATLLKQVDAGHHVEKRGFFGWFNRGFVATTHGYEGWVSRIPKRTGRFVIVYAPDRRRGRLALPAAADVVPAGRGPGLHHRQRAAAAGRDARPHARGHEAGRGLLPEAARNRCDGQRARLQLFGHRAERRARLRAAEGLEGPQGRAAQRAGGRAARVRRADGRARCVHLRAQPAADSRTRQRDRLHLPAAGPRRQRPRGARRRAQPAARDGVAEQGADAGAARRPRGRAAADARDRPRQGAGARRRLRLDQRDPLDSARLGLRQRLSERRPLAARRGPGRCAVSHAARRPAQAQHHATRRGHRCRCRPSPPRAG